MWQIRIKHLVFEFLIESELEAALLAGVRVLGFSAYELPLELHVVEPIDNLFAFFDGYGEVFLASALADAEAVGGGADLGAEIDLGGVEDLVACHAGVLIDDECKGGGERSEEVVEGGVEIRAELMGHELVCEGPNHHHGGGE